MPDADPGAVTRFPRAGVPSDVAEGVSGPLTQRCAEAAARLRRPAPWLLPSERVSALLVALPAASARQRAALLAFAVEDRVGAPIDSVAVAQAPLSGADRGLALALVAARDALAEAEAAAPAGATILPDFLAIPRPQPSPSGPAWAVWRDGSRAVVRVSDGTGFAVATDALPLLWRRAGSPALTSFGAALPAALPAIDLSQNPPPPDPADLGFDFRQDRRAATDAVARPLVIAAGIAALGLVLHLGLAAVDAVALGRIAAAERATAQAALAPLLPGVSVDEDPSVILARLAPPAARQSRSDLLPMLSEISAVLIAGDATVGFRRLSWGAEDGTMSLQIQAGGLDDLQAVQRDLEASGFVVGSGAANAGDGGAEVEMRISRGPGG